MEIRHLHYTMTCNASRGANTLLKTGYGSTTKCVGFLLVFKYHEEMDGSRAGSIQGQNEPGFLHHNRALNKR